jgi:hypothetical protein
MLTNYRFRAATKWRNLQDAAKLCGEYRGNLDVAGIDRENMANAVCSQSVHEIVEKLQHEFGMDMPIGKPSNREEANSYTDASLTALAKAFGDHNEQQPLTANVFQDRAEQTCSVVAYPTEEASTVLGKIRERDSVAFESFNPVVGNGSMQLAALALPFGLSDNAMNVSAELFQYVDCDSDSVLNHMQNETLVRVIEHVNKKLEIVYHNKHLPNEQQLKPLHLFVHGGPGTGKSFFSLRLQKRLATVGLSLLCTAPTGCAAAELFRGRTLHELFSITVGERFRNKSPKDEPLKELSINQLAILQTIFVGVAVLLVDEISMVDSIMIFHISQRLQQITGQTQAFGAYQLFYWVTSSKCPLLEANLFMRRHLNCGTQNLLNRACLHQWELNCSIPLKLSTSPNK